MSQPRCLCSDRTQAIGVCRWRCAAGWGLSSSERPPLVRLQNGSECKTGGRRVLIGWQIFILNCFVKV
ncbi:MAG: hypothetical protein MIO93_08395 [ANME-2 cluster archaeon]|nr:hypothetical protein [ANME-2 cluster archaeon]